MPPLPAISPVERIAPIYAVAVALVAGDALGKIGGPKVIDAVLELVRDKDEDLRRAA